MGAVNIVRKIGRILIFLLIFGLGISMIVGAVKDKTELSKPRAKIEEMTADDFYDGRFIEGDIGEIWGEYATMNLSKSYFGITYDTQTTAHYYLMPLETSYDLEEPKFISLSVYNSADLELARKMAYEFEECVTNFDSGDIKLPESVMTMKGKVSKLRKDAVPLFNSVIEEMGFDPETSALPYVVNVGNDGSGVNLELPIGIAVTAFGLIGLFFAIVRGVRGR